jgi:MFS family permease
MHLSVRRGRPGAFARLAPAPDALLEPESAPSDLRRNLRSSTGDGVSFSLMVGMGETYLPAFVLALGLGDVAAGLITTVPLAAGAVLQLVSPAGVRRMGSHRRWVMLCALLQAACFLPLCVGAALGHMAALPVFLSAMVYWGAGLATGGAWNTWIETIVPSRVRARYFARRTRLSQLGVLSGFVVGGFALNSASQAGQTLPAFAVLFFLASLCRFASAGFLANHTEPVPLADDHRHVTAREWLARARHGLDGRLLTYLFAVQTAAQLAGPYFTPYMIRTLKLNYAHYVVLVAVAFASKAAALPLLGNFAHRHGAHRLLCAAGMGIVPMSALWIVSSNYAWLICVQLLAGVTWGAYELAMFLLFFEAIPRQERTSVLTTFNLGNSLATVVGSLLGASLLYWGDRSQSTYFILFGLSSLARALALLALLRVRPMKVTVQPVGMRTLGLSGGDSVMEQPILPSLPDEAAPSR